MVGFIRFIFFGSILGGILLLFVIVEDEEVVDDIKKDLASYSDQVSKSTNFKRFYFNFLNQI